MDTAICMKALQISISSDLRKRTLFVYNIKIILFSALPPFNLLYEIILLKQELHLENRGLQYVSSHSYSYIHENFYKSIYVLMVLTVSFWY